MITPAVNDITAATGNGSATGTYNLHIRVYNNHPMEVDAVASNIAIDEIANKQRCSIFFPFLFTSRSKAEQ